MFLSATVERFGKPETSQHRVRNLSVTGACVDGGDHFRPRETIVVTVGMLVAVGAEVVWVGQGLAGLRFTHPIEIQEALAKTARLRKRSILWPFSALAH